MLKSINFNKIISNTNIKYQFVRLFNKNKFKYNIIKTKFIYIYIYIVYYNIILYYNCKY